jgi:hypothetical protein
MSHRASTRPAFALSISVLLVAAALAAGAASPGEEQGIAFDPYKHVIWIPTRIAGGPPLNFGFDSAAASTAIDWDRAEQLKIPFTQLGEQYAGSGDNTARVGKTDSVRVAIPGATLDLRMAVVSLRAVSETYGRRMDGVIGADLLARYVTELDWKAGRMALHEPASFRYSGGGAEVPLIVAGGMPFVRMTVSVPRAAPVEGLFLVDCPHPGTIIMNAPFVQQNGLLEAARKSLPRLVTQYAEGVGGKSEILHGRIAELKLGPYNLRQPVAGFSQARAGALAQTQFAGILGAEILRRFLVIFDFSRGRIILEPKAALTEPYRYDASGLRLRSSGPDYRDYLVTGVIEDSPAAQAQLQEGDHLIEIAGKPAKTFSLGEVLDIFKRDGVTVPLKIQRGTQTIGVSLQLRQLI